MSDYGDKHDGNIGKMSSFGGKIHTAVGTTVEAMARKETSEDSQTTSPKAISETNPPYKNTTGDAIDDHHLPTSATVLDAQKRLKELGYTPGPVDGVMGAQTRIALTHFQADYKLPVTRALDRDTLKALEIGNR